MKHALETRPYDTASLPIFIAMTFFEVTQWSLKTGTRDDSQHNSGGVDFRDGRRYSSPVISLRGLSNMMVWNCSSVRPIFSPRTAIPCVDRKS